MGKKERITKDCGIAGKGVTYIELEYWKEQKEWKKSGMMMVEYIPKSLTDAKP